MEFVDFMFFLGVYKQFVTNFIQFACFCVDFGFGMLFVTGFPQYVVVGLLFFVGVQFGILCELFVLSCSCVVLCVCVLVVCAFS